MGSGAAGEAVEEITGRAMMDACALAVGPVRTMAVVPRWRCVGALVSALLALVLVAGVALERPWASADLARVSAPSRGAGE